MADVTTTAAGEPQALDLHEVAINGSGRLVFDGYWTFVDQRGPIYIAVAPLDTSVDAEVQFSPGGILYLQGEGPMRHYDSRVTNGNPEVASCGVVWVFMGQRRDKPPANPGRKWIPYRFTYYQAAGPRGKATPAAVAKLPWVAVSPCAQDTLCLGAPGSGRADLLIRLLPVGDGRQGPAYLPLTTGAVDVWSRRVGESDAAARAWQVPAAVANEPAHPGLLDIIGYNPPASAQSADLDLPDPDSAQGEWKSNPPPPSVSWLTVATLPGFAFGLARRRRDGARLLPRPDDLLHPRRGRGAGRGGAAAAAAVERQALGADRQVRRRVGGRLGAPERHAGGEVLRAGYARGARFPGWRGSWIARRSRRSALSSASGARPRLAAGPPRLPPVSRMRSRAVWPPYLATMRSSYSSEALADGGDRAQQAAAIERAAEEGVAREDVAADQREGGERLVVVELQQPGQSVRSRRTSWTQ